jgi:hypothetical protein
MTKVGSKQWVEHEAKVGHESNVFSKWMKCVWECKGGTPETPKCIPILRIVTFIKLLG